MNTTNNTPESTNAAKSSIEAEQLRFIAEGNVQARTQIAHSADLSLSLQTKLHQDTDESVLVALAGNTALLDELQKNLAHTGTPAVRKALAANPSLNETQQNYLATTGSDEVKCQLAKNPSLMLSIQSRFAVDATSGIRAALAENPSLDKTCQVQLMQDGDEYTQLHVYTMMPLASNPALSTEYHAGFAENDDSRIVASLAKNPSISTALMERFAASDDDAIRAGLACNTSLSESLQARLIAGNSNGVRINIAGNPALKIAQQALLADNGDVDVRLALLDNPELDESIRMRVAASFSNQDLNWAESALELAENISTRLSNEHHDATQKCIKAYGGIFPSSEEKIEKLNKAADRIQNRIFEADREIVSIERKCRKIKALLENQPSAGRSSTHWPSQKASAAHVSHAS